MTTLIVGCSYIENICIKSPDPRHVDINPQKFLLCGTSGSGNQAMAARVIHECQFQQFDKICVLWSGINRLDFPIGKNLHDTYPKDSDGNPKYSYVTPMGELVWYHSGGFGLSGTSDSCPKLFQHFFSDQYRSCNRAYLSQMTALSIITVQSFVKANNINCQMAFIYDVDADYTESAGYDAGYVEPGCGKLDRNAQLVSLIDWEMFVKTKPPFESGRDQKRLYDGFHPDFDFMLEWINQAFELDLRS